MPWALADRADARGRVEGWGSACEHHAQEGQAGNRSFFVGNIYCCPSSLFAKEHVLLKNLIKQDMYN